MIIAAFCLTDERIDARMIAVDARNRFVRFLTAPSQLEDEVPDVVSV